MLNQKQVEAVKDYIVSTTKWLGVETIRAENVIVVHFRKKKQDGLAVSNPTVLINLETYNVKVSNVASLWSVEEWAEIVSCYQNALVFASEVQAFITALRLEDVD